MDDLGTGAEHERVGEVGAATEEALAHGGVARGGYAGRAEEGVGVGAHLVLNGGGDDAVGGG